MKYRTWDIICLVRAKKYFFLSESARDEDEKSCFEREMWFSLLDRELWLQKRVALPESYHGLI